MLEIWRLIFKVEKSASRERQLLRKPHSINTLHSFPVVFVDFDKEDVNFHDFRQNILNPARCCAFFMYTLFFLEIKPEWRNLGFTVENIVEHVGEILNPNT